MKKKLGISGKQQIEEYGVEKFVKECKESVFTYVNMWEDMTNKVGYWVDMEHPYITYENKYIESVWWGISQMWKKGSFYTKDIKLCHIVQDVVQLFLLMK